MKFAYELLNADGRLERGAVEAASEAEARRSLQRQGITEAPDETDAVAGVSCSTFNSLPPIGPPSWQ